MKITSGTALIDWPAIPTAFNAGVLSLMYQLEATQWWPEEKLVAQQYAQLSGLLTHFARTSPTYARHLQAAGHVPGMAATPELLARLPVLTRQDLQAETAGLLSQAVPPDHGVPQPVTTSGSMGTPVTVQRTAVSQVFHQAYNLRGHLWHRRAFDTTFATVRGFPAGNALYPAGQRTAHWSPYIDSGPAIAVNTAYCTLAEQIDFLQRGQPDYLLTYPTNLAAIAAHCREHDVALPFLRGFGTFSEALYPSQRALVRDVFGLPIIDMYSSSELGMIALQCPEHEHYHVMAESLIVEILDDNDRPCAPGVTGHLVITDIHNAAMPLIRYRIGDMASRGTQPCTCGRGLPVLERIHGRVRNMLRLRSGDVIFPDVAAHRLGRIGPVRQSQVVQTGYDSIELRLALKRPMNLAEEAEILKAIRESLGRPFEVTLVIVDEIPRSAGGKFEDFVCAFSDVDANRRV